MLTPSQPESLLVLLDITEVPSISHGHKKAESDGIGGEEARFLTQKVCIHPPCWISIRVGASFPLLVRRQAGLLDYIALHYIAT